MVSKRAVAPLVATILLISFSIALGAVIMNWGNTITTLQQSYEEREAQAKVKCDKFVEFEVVKDAATELCYSERMKQLRFSVSNKGSVEVEGMKLLIVGEKIDTTTFEMDNLFLEANETKEVVQNYEFGRLGPVMEFDVTPLVHIHESDDHLACSEKKLEIKEVPACT